MLEKKIKTLFEYRKIPYLLSFLKKKKANKLHKKLVQLQVAIYNLDHYLETNWSLEQKQLRKYWKKIFSALKDIGLDSEEAFIKTNHIRRYQKHEVQLREAKMPTVLNKEYYYYYKSCDVRLMRDIIYHIAPEISENIALEDWRYFDLITEINDDVEDVFEDQLVINGNMFLILIIEKGLSEAVDGFKIFIDEIQEKATKQYAVRGSSVAQDMLLDLTKKEVKLTLELLAKNSKKLKKESINAKMPLLTKNVL